MISMSSALCLLASFNNASKHPAHDNNVKEVKWNILNNSSISIRGSSNINTFTCQTNGAFKAETLRGLVTKSNKTVEMAGAITVPIEQFDCKNRMLNTDLRKTLKADTYPEMKIQFLSLERMPIPNEGEDYVSGYVIIELAGKKKKFHLRYAFSEIPNGLILSGSRSFSFADFELSPPKKVGGLIKVRDDFDVGFTLVLSKVN